MWWACPHPAVTMDLCLAFSSISICEQRSVGAGESFFVERAADPHPPSL